MKKLLVSLALAGLVLPHPALARKRAIETWIASRVTDPITGEASCTVSVRDRAAGVGFTRTGALYPVVELNSTFGLLVGVSSGGSYRIPTGDILWRVDDMPFHELKAADNPAGSVPSAVPPEVAASLGADATEALNRTVASASATSTMASGDRARKMLDEMLAGKGLLYRSAAIRQIGLPDARSLEVGLVTREGLRPIPLDQSFRAALEVCGISSQGAAD